MIIRRILPILLAAAIAWAQAPAPAVPPPAPAPPPPDSLGRDTPRGTVIGFLSASGKGDYETARRYLNTATRGARSDTLALQLKIVLDRKLPAQLNKLSTKPEGSQYYPDRPDSDLVGSITGPDGMVDIVVERVGKGKTSPVWLFSKETLIAVPQLYEEINVVTAEDFLPAFLTQTKILSVPLFQWISIFIGIPLVYWLIGVLESLVSPLFRRAWIGLRRPELKSYRFAPPPVRLLLIVMLIRWMVAHLNFALLTRQVWLSIAVVFLVTASVWLLFLLNGWIEEHVRRRLGRMGVNGALSILRLVRRTGDLVIIFAGALALLAYFKLNVTAALAGLGVGGIAIALAAQKTLENVIGGISIIADRAVRIGDVLKLGETTGTVEDIGLRSTRIRTMDRSIVSIPNAQISNERLEDLSSRDKFWFHPILNLRYETTAAQMRSVLDAVRNLLLEHPLVERDSVRVRFLRFGPSSLDIDIFAYVYAVDFPGFLEIQEGLLLRIMDAIQTAGTRMAFPSQTTYLASDAEDPDAALRALLKIPARSAN